MALSPGMVVAGYTIEGVLGAGGMGTVYKARNPRSAQRRVKGAVERGRQADERYPGPGSCARPIWRPMLDHPNIVTVYTRGETSDGQLWIAMQYVDGSDAENRVARQGG